MTTWKRATEIVVGRTYSWHENGSSPWVAHTVVEAHGEIVAVVMWPTGHVTPYVTKRSRPQDMPYEKSEVPRWLVRTEHRLARPGETYIVRPGLFETRSPASRGSGRSVDVLVIEPNPEWQP